MAKRIFPITVVMAAISGALIVLMISNTGAQPGGTSAPSGPRIATEAPRIDISATPTQRVIRRGDVIGLTVKVDNLSGSTLENIDVRLTPPASITVETLPDECELQGNTVLCQIASVPSPGSTLLPIDIQIGEDFSDDGETLIAEAAQGDQFFVRTANRIPLSAALVSSAIANPDVVSPGDNVGIVVGAQHRGDQEVSGGVLSFTIPATLSVKSIDDRCTLTDGAWICPLPTMQPGDTENFTIAATALATFPATGDTMSYGVAVETPSRANTLQIDGPESELGAAGGGCDGCPYVGNVFGDPHVRTFDGIGYDMQTVGEFIYVDMPAPLGDVQARFTPWAETSRRLSGVLAVAVDLGASKVEINATGELLIDGQPETVEVDSTLDLGDGAAIHRTGPREHTLVWPGTGQRADLKVSSYGRFMNLGMRLPDSLSGEVLGLLGNADGNLNNDFTGRNGTVLAARPTATLIHTSFADNWRISDEESLFTYEPGESTSTFTDPSFPDQISRLSDLTPEQRELAEAICRSFGITDPFLFDSCVLDVGISDGDSVFAAAALNLTPPVLALDGVLSSEVILGDEPARYYQFDGSGDAALQDSAGSGNPVAISNGVTQTVGPIANEPDLGIANTLAGFMAIASADGLAAGAEPRTIEFWMEDLGSPALLHSVFAYGDLEIYHYGSVRQLTLRQAGSQIAKWVAPEAISGSWHHIAMTYENGLATMYVDGSSIGTQAVALNTQMDDGLRMGQLGAFDEVALYDRALSAYQINEHHAVGRSADGQPCRRVSSDAYSALVTDGLPSAYYRFDDRNTDGSISTLVADSARNCLGGAITSSASPATSPIGGATAIATSTTGSSATLPSIQIPGGSDTRTIEFWINDTASSLHSIIDYGNLSVFNYGNVRQITLRENNSQIAKWSTPESISGEWHYIVLTIDNGSANLYVDGAFAGTQPVTIDTNFADGSIQLRGPASFDEFAVYDRVLTQSEISDRWSVGATGNTTGGCGEFDQDLYSQTVTADAPLTYFRFDELTVDYPTPRIALDAGSSCTPGTYTGIATPITSTVGDANKGLGRSGGSAAMMFSPSTNLPSGPTDRTVEMWIQATGSSQTLLRYENFGITTSPNSGQIGWSQDGTQVDRIGGINLTDMKHVVISVESLQGTVYIDGVNAGSLDLSSLNTSGGGRLEISSFAAFDEVAIYDRALTAAEVQAHFAAAG